MFIAVRPLIISLWVFLSLLLILTCLVCCSIGWQERGNIDTELGLTSQNESFEKLVRVRPNDMKCSRLCALGARLVMHRFRDYAQLGCCGASFFLPPSPRCAQDVRIVSPLIQAVSAHCFLFKHKSHRLTLNCRCLSPPAGEHSIVAFIKSQELCTFKINECASLDANNMWTHNFGWLFFFQIHF